MNEAEFRKRFDEATGKAMHDSGIIDLLMVLRLNNDEDTFNQVKDDIARDIERIRSEVWHKQLSGAQIDMIDELRATIKKYEPFIKSSVENAKNGSLGGKQKGEKMYHDFVTLVKKKKIPLADYPSNEKLRIALQDFGKDEGYKIDAKTAGNYKKRYLQENPGK